MSTFSYNTAKILLTEAEKERIICTYLNTTDPNANVRALSLLPLPTTALSLTARTGRLGQSRRRVWLQVRPELPQDDAEHGQEAEGG